MQQRPVMLHMVNSTTSATSAPASRLDNSGIVSALRMIRRAAPGLTAAIFVLNLAVAGATALLLLLVRRIVELLSTQPAQADEVLLTSIYLAVVLAITGLLPVVISELSWNIHTRVDKQVKGQILLAASEAEYAEYEKPEFHNRLMRAATHTSSNTSTLVYTVSGLAQALAAATAVVLVLVGTVPQILPILVLASVPLLAAARTAARMGYHTSLELSDDDRLRGSLSRALTSKLTAREVRLLNLSTPLGQRWSTLYEARIAKMVSVSARRGAFLALAALFSGALAGTTVWLVAREATEGSINLGDASIAVVGVHQLLQRTRQTATSAGRLQEIKLFLDDAAPFLNRQHQAPPDPGRLVPLQRGISIEDVSFTYPTSTTPTLNGISFEVPVGEIVAIVGASGAGKSTLVHILAGLYSPTGGAVRWDDADAATIPLQDRRHSTAVTFQDHGRFELAISENISLGRYEQRNDEPRIRDAAASAGIAATIDALPRGYATIASRQFDDGIDLSVGQWQRLAVARALFRDAPFVILDEPSASLDVEAELHLMAELRRMKANRCTIVVSHRFSTVKRADRIVVLHEGKIVEAGTHEELLDIGGRYEKLFTLQMSSDTNRTNHSFN